MSKATEWVNKTAEPRFQVGVFVASVGWAQPDPDKPRVPTLDIKVKQALLTHDEALAFGRWLLDTFSDEPMTGNRP